MGLITLSEYHTLTNTTNSASDTYITEMIDVVSDKIEKYCDRTFTATNYKEEVSINGCRPTYQTEQYPVNRVIVIGQPNTAIEYTNNSASNVYSITTTPTTMYINDEALNETSYDLVTTYSTLSGLETQVESDTNLLLTVKSNVSQVSKFLKEGTFVVEESGSATQDGMDIGGTVTIINDNTLEFGCGGSYIIYYNAGYSTIPEPLQQVVAQMTETAVALSADSNALGKDIKSESITNYSYTLQDSVDYNDLIKQYQSVLDQYKRIHI